MFNDQDNELTNLDSVTVIRNPNSANELVNKNFLDDEVDKKTILSFNQTLITIITICKYLSETTHINLLNIIKYKLLTQLSSNQVIMDVTYFRTAI